MPSSLKKIKEMKKGFMGARVGSLVYRDFISEV